MKNLRLLFGHYPIPTRVERLARLLRLAGMAIGVLAFFVVVAMTAPSLPAPYLPPDGAAVSPQHPLLIGFSPLRVRLAAARLYEIPLDGPTVGAAQAVEVNLVPLSATLPWEPIQIQVYRADGNSLLHPDAFYYLALEGDWSSLALPWLKVGQWNAVYQFATMASPKPVLPDGPMRPHYQQPITLQWDTPVTGFSYRVSPLVPSSSTLDSLDPRRAYLTMLDYEPGRTYVVEVTDATATNGVSLKQSFSFSVVMPKPPEPRLINSAELRLGDLLILSWDERIVDFDYHLDPPELSTSAIDPVDQRRSFITLQTIRQGQQYHLTVTAAGAENGTHLKQPYTFMFATTPALEVTETTPGDGAFGISPNQTVCVTFSEAVADRVAAEHALTISPAVSGRFEWSSSRELCFVPAEPFPFEGEVVARLAGGLKSVRGESKSYLEDDVIFRFTIRPDKLIDIDLRRQVVSLLEGGKVVVASPTSTGVRGAETPVGTYMVQYKMKTARMRGVTPSGARYDIPDVPWVLAFWDDYTIHGSYWRSGFGFPQSNGCVTLPVPVAKELFYWAPVGTPIEIHY